SCPAQYSLYFCKLFCSRRYLTSFPTRRSSDLTIQTQLNTLGDFRPVVPKHFLRADVMMLGNLHPNTQLGVIRQMEKRPKLIILRSEEHTSELQSRENLVCRLLLEKKKLYNKWN